MNKTVKAAAPSYGTDGSFTATLSGLTPGQKYYFRAYAVVNGTESYASQEKTMEASSYGTFTMPAASQEDADPAVSGKSWLELPGAVSSSNYLVNTYYGGSESDANRNYTHCYDKTTYTSLWAAYHLNSSHMGDLKRLSSWYYSPSIDEQYQVNLKSSSYAGDTYSRGHMIPNSSRNGNEEMQKQTFYVTNSVPQRQNKFNGSIWERLESALQAIADSEEIYIVTGVAFNKVGENRSISYVSAQKASSDGTIKSCPVPNYFYKVVLKVNKSGSTVTSASTIGFWFDHRDYEDGESYVNYKVSVDQIEQWTGFDFFVNLPDGIENDAERNDSWETF